MQFRSRDVATVESTWQQFVPSASLQNVDPHRFRFDWRSGELGGATLVRYDLAAQVHSRVEPEEQLLACRVEATDARVWSKRDDLDARTPWLTDGRRVEARWDHDARVRALIFDRGNAQELARQITGDDALDLRVSGPSPHSPRHAAQWDAMFAYLDQTLDDSETDALVDAELERHALLVTLSTFSSTFSASLRRPPQRAAAPVTVRRALAYIDDNAHLPITVDDVAAATYISTRGLQYAFRRALGLTPTEALRRARLEGAHRDLQGGNGPSVATIARRWGFSNVSRFALAYRETYGKPPGLPRT